MAVQAAATECELFALTYKCVELQRPATCTGSALTENGWMNINVCVCVVQAAQGLYS